MARHAPDEITDAMNRVCDQLGTAADELPAVAACSVLEHLEW